MSFTHTPTNTCVMLLILIQVVYVMPSTSGRAATYPKRSDKLKFFNELKDLRDKLQREREEKTMCNGDTTQPDTLNTSSTTEPAVERLQRVPVIVGTTNADTTKTIASPSNSIGADTSFEQ